jgi:hypothetical protein
LGQCSYPDALSKVLLPALGIAPIVSSPLSFQLRLGGRRLSGRREWRAASRPDLFHLRQLNQLICGSPEPVLVPASGHSKVVSPQFTRAHRPEEFSLNTFGHSGSLSVS